MKNTGTRKVIRHAGILLCLMGCLWCAGCGMQKIGTEKIRDVDYTVVTEEEIPGELLEKIEAQKAEDFKMTYMLDDALYIVRGFGMQATGGYSIQVQNLYLAENALYFESDLIGPENGSQEEKAVSYPYIVVKTERLEENVVFE